MNYENSRPIGSVSSGDTDSKGYYGKDNSTVSMTFEQLQKTWRLKERYEKDIVQHSGFGDIPENFQDSAARGL